MTAQRTQVCGTCPWNRRSTLGYWHPAHLIGIAYTCSAVIPLGTMACHQWNGQKSPSRTPDAAPLCGGWVRVSSTCGTVRLGVRKGALNPADLTDTAGHKLYRDAAEMLRWNGIDPSRFPPLVPPGDGTETVAWVNTLVDLHGRMRSDPESAHGYVMRASPMRWGVHQDEPPFRDGVSRMPEAAMARWIEECKGWSALVYGTSP